MTTMQGGHSCSSEVLFQPYRMPSLNLSNRIVMAPMTRGQAPNGVLGPDNVAYYRRRAEAGVGLIITEGTWIDHPVAGDRTSVPRFFGADALAAWKLVVEAVHNEGGRIMPQLWHVGMARKQGPGVPNPRLPSVGPSGLQFVDPEARRLEQVSKSMARAEIDAVVESYGRGAENACRLGFDGIELHAAHGYLIDQFFWSITNRRTDEYGGGLSKRTRFAAEIVRECRRRTRPDFPICLRFSQWKSVDYEAKLAQDPQELEEFLTPLAAAGVDIFHCSTRRFWQPAFEGSGLTLAGWTKKITGKTTIAVGSVGLDRAHETSRLEKRQGYTAGVASLDQLVQLLEQGEFDLAAVGRALLVDHAWVKKVREHAWGQMIPYSTAVREILY